MKVAACREGYREYPTSSRASVEGPGGVGGTPPPTQVPRLTLGMTAYRATIGSLTHFVVFITVGHDPVSSSFFSPVTSSISTSAMFETIHSKFVSPTDLRSASGAQFMKSIA